jgi:uncharacterized protein YhdP
VQLLVPLLQERLIETLAAAAAADPGTQTGRMNQGTFKSRGSNQSTPYHYCKGHFQLNMKGKAMLQTRRPLH